MLLRARRPFLIGGKQVVAGEVVDLSLYDLPSGRVQRLVDSRLGEYVAVPVNIECEFCARPFASAHALATHIGRSHRNGPDSKE